MNPFVKKEIRLLLPSFLLGLALAFSVWLIPARSIAGVREGLAGLPFLCCPAVLVMMMLASFGHEFSAGTFSLLLSQPVPRLRIWWTKTLLLGVAALLTWLAWCVCYWLHNPGRLAPTELLKIFAGFAIYVLVGYSGGLWTMLLFRQVAAAFWFTVLIPAMLVVTLGNLLEDYPAYVQFSVPAGVLTIYGIAGFLLARWLFLRAQDVAWTGGNVAMPEVRGLARFRINSDVHRTWRPRMALFIKEVQLHQSQFVLAGVLVLLHLGVCATRNFGHIQRNSSLELILDIFWGLWLVMPMLVGAAAVAEERRLGVMEGQLCLPVKRSTQFAVKFRVALLLSVLFGVVLPLLLEGQRILPRVHFGFNPYTAFVGMEGVAGWQNQMSTGQSFLWHCFSSLYSLLPLLTLAGMATAIGAIAFYASTFARNTLQALAPAVLGILVFAALLTSAYRPEFFFGYPLWRGWLIYLIGVPIFVIALVAMSFWNFQRIDIGGKVWRRNTFMFVVALAFVIAATTAIYHRAWEKLTPFEPSHDGARLSLSNPPTMSEQWSTLSVRLPDGRIWADDYTLNAGVANPLALVLGNIKLTSLGSSHYLNGSNWMVVVRGFWFQQVGIKNDGTLWVSEKPARPDRLERGGWKMPKTGDLMQFGGETNWTGIVWHDRSMLLVKNDGTLWRWGTTNWNYTHNQWLGLQSFTPYRLGTESNWVEMFLAGYQLCLRKTDGSTWTPWYTYMGNERQKIELEPGFSVVRTSLFKHGKWRGTTRTRSGLDFYLGVGDNGTFRIMADQRLNNQSHSYEWNEADLQFGKDTNWLGVAGHYEKIVTLKNDGMLWLWNFHHDYRYGWYLERDEREMLEVKPVRLGTHSDWIAITGADGGIISLAADGSLWYWPLENADYLVQIYNGGFLFGNHDSNIEPLLDISRKPQRLGNIFDKAD